MPGEMSSLRTLPTDPNARYVAIPPNSRPPQKRKREPRAAIACEGCRKRKSKCDGKQPCAQCVGLKLSCVFAESKSDNRKVARSEDWSRSTQAASQPSEGRASEKGNGAQQSSPLLSNAGALNVRPPESKASDSMGPPPQRSASSREQHEDAGATSQDEIGPTDADTSRARLEIPPDQRAHRKDHESPVYHATAISETEQSGPDSVGEINTHTSGTEFYGTTGIIPFLNRLRSRAQSFTGPAHPQNHDFPRTLQSPNPERVESQSSHLRNLSIVNYLYNADYQKDQQGEPRSHDPIRPQPRSLDISRFPASLKGARQYTGVRNTQSNMSDTHKDSEPGMRQLTQSSGKSPSTNPLQGLYQVRNIAVERTCLAAYFQNLHLLHPILDKESFLKICERYLADTQPERSDKNDDSEHRKTRFQPVYYSVLALGAIVAPDEVFETSDTIDALRLSSYLFEDATQEQAPSKTPNIALLWANLFFEKAKEKLPDVFQVSSLESTQALSLLSVFCQHALQPHSCYMYSGMAARTALAIGMPNERPNASPDRLAVASRTWWCIYAHEIETCSSSGRDTILRDPGYYWTPMPTAIDTIAMPHHSQFIKMVADLAHILSSTSDSLYHCHPSVTIHEKRLVSRRLDDLLENWREAMPDPYQLGKSSLTEPQWISKQKVILKLRYHNAKILIYRPFLELNSGKGLEASMHIEIDQCLQAACNTVRLLYDTYLHRPYFRTWWYNTTYAFNACMVILYVMLLGIHDELSDELIADVEKTLEIFHAMQNVTAARRCAFLTQEMFDIAKHTIAERARDRKYTNVPTSTFIDRSVADQPVSSAKQNPELSSDPAQYSSSSVEPSHGSNIIGFDHEDLYESMFVRDLINQVDHEPLPTFEDSVGGGGNSDEIEARARNGYNIDDWQFDQRSYGGVLEAGLPLSWDG